MHITVYGDTLCAQVTATAMAQTGHRVNWRVVEPASRERLARGLPLFREQGLDRLFADQLESGRLIPGFWQELPQTAPDAVFLAFPPGEQAAAEGLARRLASSTGCGVIVNQTVGPVGAAEQLRDIIKQIDPRAVLVALPDLIQEGNAFQTFTRPDSILLGCEEGEGESLVRELLRPFNRRKDVIHVMSLREAEFAKLAISGILATRISYMNDMACLSESLGVDIDVVRVAMGADPRIGESYLYPGCGFGGPGLSSNVLALVDALNKLAAEPGLLERVLQTNERQKEVLFRKFWQFHHGNLAGKKVALWGVAFKPGTHRVDNAPALKVIEALWAQGVEVTAHDPKALPDLQNWAQGRGELTLCDDPYDAAEGADALMLITEWKPYWSPDWQRLKRRMREPLILDGRNIYEPAFVREQGLIYRGIGR
ncbi:UDP-glucose/GDP-mannose dehydrogenase family protein [Alcanivorax profundi]|uniref:UDP-glucose 6-dehydrogenase n=1 Tax=Alcanivorax profundi TaxID=2338368 RepID=A0A418XXA2_9GAMM|nr:nucleotide sugar dehydrogenase [Alcanivorax profundi]RJG17432.1 UDP-glucose/GDP-mannose dehydrogenase family protein [Alcanivorax profundi]